jgi:hypothetical protein
MRPRPKRKAPPDGEGRPRTLHEWPSVARVFVHSWPHSWSAPATSLAHTRSRAAPRAWAAPHDRRARCQSPYPRRDLNGGSRAGEAGGRRSDLGSAQWGLLRALRALATTGEFVHSWPHSWSAPATSLAHTRSRAAPRAWAAPHDKRARCQSPYPRRDLNGGSRAGEAGGRRSDLGSAQWGLLRALRALATTGEFVHSWPHSWSAPATSLAHTRSRAAPRAWAAPHDRRARVPDLRARPGACMMGGGRTLSHRRQHGRSIEERRRPPLR